MQYYTVKLSEELLKKLTDACEEAGYDNDGSDWGKICLEAKDELLKLVELSKGD